MPELKKASFFLQITTTDFSSRNNFESSNRYFPIFEFATEEDLLKQLDRFLTHEISLLHNSEDGMPKVTILNRIS